MKRNILFPLDTKIIKKKLWGLDIETYGKKNKFLMGSIVGDDNINEIFWDKNSLIEFLVKKLKIFRHGFIVATNLQFDILGLIDDTKYMKIFFPLFRGSSLIYAKLVIDRYRKLQFLDTMNYAPFSVKKWGDILGIPKLPKPRCFKRKPENEQEIRELEKYNLNDSFISYKAIQFLQDNFNDIGCSLKKTIASTSMNLFQRKFLNYPLVQPERNILKFMYDGYYGGRTEIIKRGRVKNLKYYDVNSMYSSAMLNEYPHPSSMFIVNNPKRNMIFEFEGISEVEVTSNDLYIPYLPYRYEENGIKKLIFANGKFKGIYTHFELRKAILLGYRVDKIHRMIGYSKTSPFFKKFVTTLYEKRKECKEYDDPVEHVYKLLLNSLYGKFAQKIDNNQEIIHMDNVTLKMLENSINHLQSGNFMIFNKSVRYIPKFVNPIFSIYTTAYARDALYDLFSKHEKSIYYYDTDSLMTSKVYDTSDKLGDLKLEFNIDDGILVKPKMYIINDLAKCKGVSRLTKEKFMDILITKKANIERFVKFREANRRKLNYNEIINFNKLIDLEDNKRVWDSPFNIDELQISTPISL